MSLMTRSPLSEILKLIPTPQLSLVAAQAASAASHHRKRAWADKDMGSLSAPHRIPAAVRDVLSPIG
eukprot:1098042-Rhodomonas_salina.3